MNSLKSKLAVETAAGVVAITLIILLLVACVVFGPLLVITSLNALFPALAIPWNIYTWGAVTFLWLVGKSSVSVKK